MTRNELANEYAHTLFHVMRDVNGNMVPVNELDDAAFNADLENDLFERDPSLNVFDRGWSAHQCYGVFCAGRPARTADVHGLWRTAVRDFLEEARYVGLKGCAFGTFGQINGVNYFCFKCI